MNIAIIGGGASGLMAAITLKNTGNHVTIFEYKERLAKKILATGNGKCNFTNAYFPKECYRGTDLSFTEGVFKQFSSDDLKQFFKQIGIDYKEKNGYYYPLCEQASAVADTLCIEAKNACTEIIYAFVNEIKASNGKFDVYYKTNEGSNESKKFDKVLIATGSPAGINDKKPYVGYDICRRLNHSVIPPVPALVQLKCSEKWIKNISGVRTHARVSIKTDDKIYEDTGEIIFTDTGVSGIPVFQISRYAATACLNKKEIFFSIDFFPEIKQEDLQIMLDDRIDKLINRTAGEVMIGILNNKLAAMLLSLAGINPDDKATIAFSQKKKNKFILLLKNCFLNIIGTNGFESAQVAAGGVDTSEIDKTTMQSKLIKGLYFAGEVTDVDGMCGGYNLLWAFASGYVAAKNMILDM